VVKRKNKTILNMARNLLKSKRMPKEFLAEPVASVIYLSNYSPIRSVWGKDTIRSMKQKKAQNLPSKSI